MYKYLIINTYSEKLRIRPQNKGLPLDSGIPVPMKLKIRIPILNDLDWNDCCYPGP